MTSFMFEWRVAANKNPESPKETKARTTDFDEMALDRAEIQRRYRERKKAKEGERYKKKERERKRKYYIPIEKLNEKEKAKRRKETLARVKKCLQKKKQARDADETNNALTTRSSIKKTEPLKLKFSFKRKEKSAGVKKRYRTALRNAYRKINELESRTITLRKQNRKIQKRLERTKSKIAPTQVGDSVIGTPRTTTLREMSDIGLNYKSKRHERVKKKLLFANVVCEEVRKNAETLKRNKLSARRLISGKIIRKYRCAREFAQKIGVSRKTLSYAGRNGVERRRNTIKERCRETVVDFLTREDNCTVLPGKKDKKKVGQETIQKCVLNDYMHNLYDKFRLEVPELRLSRAVFYRLRPKHVMLASFSTRSTCLCMRHQNMSLKLRSLRNRGINVSVNPDVFLKACECEEEQLKNLFKDVSDDDIKFLEWKKVTENDSGKSRCKQVECTLPKLEFIESFVRQAKDFSEHVKRVKNQYSQMRKLRENLEKGEILIWMDFAENFICSAMEEVQSAYWNTDMVTLHTQVIYFPKEHAKTHMSVVGVSEVLSHNSTAVLAMLKKLLPRLKEEYPQVRAVHYLSDSPTSQYRNKTMFNILCRHQDMFGLQARWNYLEAGHGKGPCDGLGASVKRSADMAIKRNVCSIQSAEDFFKWASSEEGNNSTVSYFYVSQRDYDDCDTEVKSMASCMIAVQGTFRTHAAVPVGLDRIAVRDKSCYCNDCSHDITSTSCHGWTVHRVRKEVETAAVNDEADDASEVNDHADDSDGQWVEVSTDDGDYVACVYEKEWYVGKVLEKDDADKEIKVTFMKKAGKFSNTYKWPYPEDELWVPYQAVLMVITEPAPSGKSKRIFTIDCEGEIQATFQRWLSYNAA